MNEKEVCKYACCVLAGLLLLLGTLLSYQTRRLDKLRLELESARAELERASDKQRLIEDCIERTDLVLNESFTTVEGIRAQVRAIRESYQEMENILYGSNPSDSSSRFSSDSADH